MDTRYDSLILTNHAECLEADCPSLWVFGYGSLLWKPGFEYASSKVGYIQNYERRFNQGNETFRGTKEKPGRVANLEEKKGAQVWGVAFEVCGKEEVFAVLRNLYIREIACGGYDVMMTHFFPREERSFPRANDVEACCSHQSPGGAIQIQVLVFTPTRENSLYLGSDRSFPEMAREIVETSGCAGTNAEYVLRICDFVREHIPEDDDVYLFRLAAEIRQLQKSLEEEDEDSDADDDMLYSTPRMD